MYAAGHPGVTPQNLRLYLVQVVLERVYHRGIALDDLVHDLIEDLGRPPPEPVGLALHSLADAVQRGSLGVEDRNYEVRSHESAYLTELDPLCTLHVARRFEHDKEAATVAFEPRTPVGPDRVLDRQLV